MAVWKGHSFNTISGREAEKFSGKDSGKGDSDFNDSDSDISGDALKKDLINHMQSGEDSSFLPSSAFLLSLPCCPPVNLRSQPPPSSPLFSVLGVWDPGLHQTADFKMSRRGSSTAE